MQRGNDDGLWEAGMRKTPNGVGGNLADGEQRHAVRGAASYLLTWYIPTGPARQATGGTLAPLICCLVRAVRRRHALTENRGGMLGWLLVATCRVPGHAWPTRQARGLEQVPLCLGNIWCMGTRPIGKPCPPGKKKIIHGK